MHQCKQCGQDTDHYCLCDDCIDVEAGDPKLDPKAYSEKLDKLWEKETNAWYAAKGY